MRCSHAHSRGTAHSVLQAPLPTAPSKPATFSSVGIIAASQCPCLGVVSPMMTEWA